MENSNKDLSLIVFGRNGVNSENLDTLLDSFLTINTYHLAEIIVLNHKEDKDISSIIKKHLSNLFICPIISSKKRSFSELFNYAVQRANYPYILFVNHRIKFTADVLPAAIAKLKIDLTFGSVGIRLDDDPETLPTGQEQGIQHLGISFKWNEKSSCHLPETIRCAKVKDFDSSLYPSAEYPAITNDFLLCRKKDFENLKGFSEELVCFEDIDFCLRLKRDLNKKCWCINDKSLHISNNSFRADVDSSIDMQCPKAQEKFCKIWNDYISCQLKLKSSLLSAQHEIFSDKSVPFWFKYATPLTPTSRPVYDLPIVVAACNRPNVLERLLRSLNRAQYHQNVLLIISIDGSADNAKVIKVAESFNWLHGPLEIRRMDRHLGCRQHILACGDIADEHDGIIILEDDLFVSPVFYSYAQQAFDFFKDDTLVAGISLYTHQYNETAHRPFVPLTDQSDVFFLQVPSSWGAMWSNAQWSRFRSWQQNAVYPLKAPVGVVPGDVLNWPKTSWKKDYFFYNIDKGLFFVYPRVSLTTNFGDHGVHMPKNSCFQVPLRYGDKEYHFITCKNSLSRYDAFCELLPESLNMLQPALAEFDYSVDLYGMKPWTESPPYTLTVKPVTEALMTFGQDMLPLEANILHGITGSRISFAHTSLCDKEISYQNLFKYQNYSGSFLYYYNLHEWNLNFLIRNFAK